MRHPPLLNAIVNTRGRRRRNRKVGIFDLVKTFRYGEVVERCNSHPHEVRKQRCRSDVFPRAYHRSSCDSSTVNSDSESVLEYNDAPRTVLHAVCADGHVPVDVVTALVVAWPAATSLRMKGSGRTPLHHASCVALDSRVLQTLLEADASALYARDYYHRTPLAHLCHTYSVTIRQALENYKTPEGRSILRRLASHPKEGFSCTSKRKQDPLALLWRNASMLVKELAKAKLAKEVTGKGRQCSPKLATKSNFCMVHACLSIGRECPKSLLELALRIHPEQLREADTSDDGNLPLHVLCQRGELRFVRKFLSFFPEASEIPNKSGRLPLHLLVERLSRDAVVLDENTTTAVDEMIRHNPDAVLTIEHKSGLTPFMFAAAAAAAPNDCMEQKETQKGDEEVKSRDAAQVSLIYELFLSHPVLTTE